MKITLTRSFRLESARFLPRLPATHPCSRVHGHSFVVELELHGEVDPEIGWLIDYNDIAAAFAPLAEQLDHRLLNEVPGLENPTSEYIARWIYEGAKPALKDLSAVIVMETPETRAIYRAEA